MSDWTELMGDDIRIRRQKEGVGCSASVDTVVYFDMKTYYLELECEPILIEEESCLAAKIGDSDFLPGVELGLRHSKVGEHFVVRCHPKFGYGSSGRASINGCPVIPPDVEVRIYSNVAFHTISSRPFRPSDAV
jgi:hypothetical protein